MSKFGRTVPEIWPKKLGQRYYLSKTHKTLKILRNVFVMSKKKLSSKTSNFGQTSPEIVPQKWYFGALDSERCIFSDISSKFGPIFHKESCLNGIEDH